MLEAGMDSENMDNMHMAGAYVLSSDKHNTIDALQVDTEPQGRDRLEHHDTLSA